MAAADDAAARFAPGRRLPALDGLRGVAILLVLMHQLLLPGFDAFGPVARRIGLLMDIGWVGVTLFFVLSGYLITQLLLGLQDEPGALRAFYLRRLLRIVPLCYAVVLAAFGLRTLLGSSDPHFHDDRIVWYLLFVSNWAQAFGVGGHSLGNLWSLGVEEQFYLLWPALVGRRSPAQVLRLSLAVAGGAVLVRAAMVLAGADPEAVYAATFPRLDALAAGAALAAALRLPGVLERLVARRRAIAWLALAIAVGGFLATQGYPRTRPLGQALGYTLHTVVFTLWLAATLAADLARDVAGGPAGAARHPLRAPLLRSFGLYSYAIYLVHKPLHDDLGPWLQAALAGLGARGPALTLLYLASGILLLWLAGWVIHRAVERPLQRLRPDYRPAGAGLLQRR